MDIGVSYPDRFESNPFSDFAESIKAPELRLQVEAREPEGFRAGVEWLLPTAAVVFLAKSYFDAFLKEMGKDHYLILKSSLKRLARKILGPSAPHVTRIASSGKVREDDPYSFAFSVLADIAEDRRAKLLFRTDASEEDIERTVEAFAELILSLQEAGAMPLSLPSGDRRWTSRTVLFAYDRDSGKLKILDPMEKAQQSAARRTGSSSASASR